MARRYKTGTHERYDQTWVKLRNSSDILAASGEDKPTVHTNFYDRQNLEYTLKEYVGDQNGEIVKDGNTMLAIIPGIEQKLKEIEKQFQKLNQRRSDEGREAYSEMPDEMLEKLYKLEAALDLRNEEVQKIEQRIASFVEKEDVQSSGKVLKYGLMGTGRLRGGVLVELDGQTCVKTSAGIMIRDTRSPFNGMLTVDYFKLCKVWQEERRKADQEHLQKLVSIAKKNFDPIPRHYASFGGTTPVPPILLPAWPADVKNYLEDESTLSRTK